jgi:SAM-dependent methyltransferase
VAVEPDDDDVDTESKGYADRLVDLESVWWKRMLPVQAPYQWNVRRQRLGRALDVGCGIGRHLGSLATGSVGIDHNRRSVEIARARGFDAFTPEEFLRSDEAVLDSFDGLLLAHVVEHMRREEARSLLATYLPYVRPGGRVFLVCPQERGYASDPTHVTYTTGHDLVELAHEVGLAAATWRSFPFPRAVGRVFLYNEFNVLATKRVPAA